MFINFKSEMKQWKEGNHCGGTWTSLSRSHQSAQGFPGVRQAVHALGVPIAEEELVLVEQGEGFLHRADGGVDANLRLPNLKQENREETVRRTIMEKIQEKGWMSSIRNITLLQKYCRYFND